MKNAGTKEKDIWYIIFRKDMRSKKITKHHIVPKSKWWTNDECNIILLEQKEHRDLHRFFENDRPDEQLRRLFKINRTALSEEVKSDIIEILNITELEYWYRKWTFKK